MSWVGIANNQCVSCENLQDAVTTGVFVLKNTIPSTTPAKFKQITKTEAAFYVNLNESYAPFAAKAANQLVVKSNLQAATPGTTTTTTTTSAPGTTTTTTTSFVPGTTTTTTTIFVPGTTTTTTTAFVPVTTTTTTSTTAVPPTYKYYFELVDLTNPPNLGGGNVILNSAGGAASFTTSYNLLLTTSTYDPFGSLVSSNVGKRIQRIEQLDYDGYTILYSTNVYATNYTFPTSVFNMSSTGTGSGQFQSIKLYFEAVPTTTTTTTSTSTSTTTTTTSTTTTTLPLYYYNATRCDNSTNYIIYGGTNYFGTGTVVISGATSYCYTIQNEVLPQSYDDTVGASVTGCGDSLCFAD